MTRRARSGGGGPAARPGGEGSDPTLDPMDRLRRSIDAIDKEMVRLLNDRAGCAIALGRIKKDRGLPIYQPAREEEVLGNVQRVNAGPLESEALRRLFERIIDESRRIERIAIERSSGRGPDPADSGESQD